MEEYLEVDDYRVNIFQYLGGGCQGQIFQCLKISTNEEIVAKITKINFKNENTYEREISIVNSIKNEEKVQNLVKIYDIFIIEKDGEKLLIEFMEKCESDLGKLMKQYKQQNQQFTFQEVLDFSAQIIRGYSCLNSLNIIHRDMKPENLLIQRQAGKIELKITDFGVGKVLTNDVATTKTGTPIYQAPELSSKELIYTSKSDIFSLGVILYQLVYNNEIPFKSDQKSIDHIKQSLKTQPIKCPQKEGFEPEFLELIEQMLLFSQHDRIGWDQLINHYYFKNYFPEKNQYGTHKNFKNLYEYVIAIYNQTCKIQQILDKIPQEFDWQIASIMLTQYVLINFQKELFHMLDSIKIENQQFNKSISTVFHKKVDKNEIQQALQNYKIQIDMEKTNQVLEDLKQKINQILEKVSDSFFKDFYNSTIQQPEDQSLFDFWHLKFQHIFRTYIRTWLSGYMRDKRLSLTEVFQLEKFSYLLDEYPKTSYNDFEQNQIHSKIIQQDFALQYLKQKQII